MQDDQRRAAAHLDDAINRGVFDEVKDLLDRGYDPNWRDIVGDTMLINAAWVGAREIVQVLIERGADVNGRGKDGQTALSRVLALDDPAEYGHDTVIALLRAHGAQA